MTILLSGSSGFLGRVIKKELPNIITIGRNCADIYYDFSIKSMFNAPLIDCVIHCAGIAHFVHNFHQRDNMFHDFNVLGTKNFINNLLITKTLPKSFIFISSVSVYGKISGELITEEDELIATDPYGSSKLQAEKLVLEWGEKNHVRIGILRLPLIVGENPPGNLGAMIKGIRSGRYFRIGDGGARKSMVLAEDIAKIIPKLAEIGGIYNLTDGIHPSFRELDVAIQKKFGIFRSIRAIPLPIAKVLARIGDILESLARRPVPINTNKLGKITSSLTFSDKKARRELGWDPNSVIEYYSKGSPEIANKSSIKAKI